MVPRRRAPSVPRAVRTAVVPVRLTPAERTALAAEAQQHGCSLSELLRRRALGRRLPPVGVPEVNRQAYGELARLAANLNQLAHQANAGFPVTVDTGLLVALTAHVQALRLALLGVHDDCEAQ